MRRVDAARHVSIDAAVRWSHPLAEIDPAPCGVTTPYPGVRRDQMQAAGSRNT
jgi:hypothetical protein